MRIYHKIEQMVLGLEAIGFLGVMLVHYVL